MENKKRIIKIIVCIFVAVAILAIARPVYVKNGSDTAQVLAENFMSKHAYSLKDYEIIDAELGEFDGRNYIQVAYSVQPKDGVHYDNWCAGNGETGKDGWIVDKSAIVWYVNIGNVYITGIQANTGF